MGTEALPDRIAFRIRRRSRAVGAAFRCRTDQERALIWAGDEFDSFGAPSRRRQLIRIIVLASLVREAGGVSSERERRQVPNKSLFETASPEAPRSFSSIAGEGCRDGAAVQRRSTKVAFKAFCAKPVGHGRAVRGQWGANGADLVEIAGWGIICHRDCNRDGRGALSCAIGCDVVFQPLHDWISPHGCAFRRGLRFVPRKRTFQGHAAGVLYLP